MYFDSSSRNKSKIKRLKLQISLLFFTLLIGLFACNKPELKNAVIKGRVVHHEWEVAGVTVYLKKNVTEFPGYDISLYDDSVKAKSSVRSEAPFAFRGLEAGDYYIYAYGYDSLFNMTVRGAQYYHISDNLEIVNKDVTVSE